MLVTVLPQPFSDRREGAVVMINVLVWLLAGGLVGFAATRLLRSSEEGTPLVQIIAGSLGALVGGVIFLIFDTAPLYVFTIEGLAAALMGALVILGVVHMLMRRQI
jgi:uncharacterized membrane protein YeaQ/YmgE (transglycosylase-associated protein family)